MEGQGFKYMMLGRLLDDCNYFLGYGNRDPKCLWAGNVTDHIAEMKRLYRELSEKPVWLSYNDILNLEKRMNG